MLFLPLPLFALLAKQVTRLQFVPFSLINKRSRKKPSTRRKRATSHLLNTGKNPPTRRESAIKASRTARKGNHRLSHGFPLEKIPARREHAIIGFYSVSPSEKPPERREYPIIACLRLPTGINLLNAIIDLKKKLYNTFYCYYCHSWKLSHERKSNSKENTV